MLIRDVLIKIIYLQMRSAVSNVAKYFPTAIISGRSRDKVTFGLISNSGCFRSFFICRSDLLSLLLQVYELVGLTELCYAGSHGMDIMLPVENTLSANDSKCIKTTDQQVFTLAACFIRFFPFIHSFVKTVS